MIKHIIFILMWLLSAAAHPADCRKTGEVCSDGPGYKTISGVSVYRSCWKYTSTYQCLKPYAVDYCSPLKAVGCSLDGTTCADLAFNGECLTNTNTYRCGDPDLPAPTNTIKLDDSYTITQDTVDYSQCSDPMNNPMCRLAAHTCVIPGGTQVINGLPVTKDCWGWKDDYVCASKDLVNDCNPLITRGCSLKSQTCTHTGSDGKCNLYEDVYSCEIRAPGSTDTQDCSTKTVCTGSGRCFETSSAPDQDFAKAVATKEAVREAGLYGDGYTMFSGEDDRCTKKNLVIIGANCCNTTSGGQSNNAIGSAVMMSAVTQGFTAAGTAIVNSSKFAFDALYSSSNPSMIAAGFQGMKLVNPTFAPPPDSLLSGFNPSFSMYGLTVSWGPLQPGMLTSVFGETGAMNTLFGSGELLGGAAAANPVGFNFYFNPYALAFQVALMVVMDFLQCTEQEQILSMKRGQNLCHLVGSYCSQELNLLVTKICIETTESYCCFNSKLAKIINEGGRAQIGKDWGDAESPSCGGFSQAEFERVDFSKIDMSEFVADIMNSVTLPNSADMVTGTAAAIQTRINSIK